MRDTCNHGWFKGPQSMPCANDLYGYKVTAQTSHHVAKLKFFNCWRFCAVECDECLMSRSRLDQLTQCMPGKYYRISVSYKYLRFHRAAHSLLVFSIPIWTNSDLFRFKLASTSETLRLVLKYDEHIHILCMAFQPYWRKLNWWSWDCWSPGDLSERCPWKGPRTLGRVGLPISHGSKGPPEDLGWHATVAICRFIAN